MSQTVRNTPASITTPALYQLSIRAPGYGAQEVATYTFPIPPASVRYDTSGASSYMDTQGTPNQQGISRVIDRYGLTPPIITIEGTTGWDYHASDGGVLSGQQSMQLLQAFLAQYATLNDGQRENGNSSYYTLEFYDYFSSQFWIIEPVGVQPVRQSADRPLLTYYRFRWVAQQAVSVPVYGPPDSLLALFSVPAQAVAVATATSISALLNNYSPVGL